MQKLTISAESYANQPFFAVFFSGHIQVRAGRVRLALVSPLELVRLGCGFSGHFEPLRREWCHEAEAVWG